MAGRPEPAVAALDVLSRNQLVAVLAGRRQWAHVDPNYPIGSWKRVSVPLLPALHTVQRQVAINAATYGSVLMAADGGGYVAADGWADPAALAGWAPDGRTWGDMLRAAPARTQALIEAGMDSRRALLAGRDLLSLMLMTAMADTHRQAAGIDVATRPGVGWIRMVGPGCCSRCAILAGRFYRWNAGFLRHPSCQCMHRPAREKDLAGGRLEGLFDDPYEYFHGLSAAEQDRLFTRAGADAIRGGADMGQVVNARSGMYANGVYTKAGSRSGLARARLGPHKRRLTPEAIQARSRSREEYVDLLYQHGYIVDKAGAVNGALRGARYEGFGQMGRGGARRGASEAVRQAQATGVRTGSRATMTAAELRIDDAARAYEAALARGLPFETAEAERRLRIALATDGDKVRMTQAMTAGTSQRASATLASEGSVRPPAPPKTALDGSGGGRPPAPPRATRGGAFGGRPEWEPEGEAFWAKRQIRLKSDTNGEHLTRAEVLCVERLEALGHRIKWQVPDGSHKSDFVWLTGDNQDWEIKSPVGLGGLSAKRQYKKIAGRISDDARWKKNFIIDIGDEPLSGQLLRQLESYNIWHRNSPDRQIRQLVVMSKGQLTRVTLR